jgi:hypothetical protein
MRITQARLQHSRRLEKVERKHIGHGHVQNPSAKGLFVTSIEISRKYDNKSLTKEEIQLSQI